MNLRLHLKRWYLKIMILTLVLMISLTGTAFADIKVDPVDYVALGDSLAAGLTPTYSIDDSYPDYIAERLDDEGILGTFNNYGYPGYTTDNVLLMINPLNIANTETIAAIKEAEIITLDIGANDLLDNKETLMANPDLAETAIIDVASNIAKIVGTLNYINSDAKIYLMGYYNAFPYYPKEQQAALILLIESLNTSIKGLADSTGITYVDTYSAMDKHLTKYLPADNIHPNTLGYKTIAKQFWNEIQADFLNGAN